MNADKIFKSVLLTAAMLQPFATSAQEKQHGVAHPSTAGKTVQVAPAVAPLVLLDPTELRAKPTLARGCWVWLFPDTNYQGQDSIAVAGPADIQSLHTPAGLDWHGKAESLIVGPKASLTVYEVQGFRGQERTFPPGFEVKQLRKDLGFIQSIDALRLSCK
ncbi:MAG: hypothetical protein ACJ8G3_12880 [Burkholderiaceae bacterium]